jgi:hypothetical protein
LHVVHEEHERLSGDELRERLTYRAQPLGIASSEFTAVAGRDAGKRVEEVDATREIRIVARGVGEPLKEVADERIERHALLFTESTNGHGDASVARFFDEFPCEARLPDADFPAEQHDVWFPVYGIVEPIEEPLPFCPSTHERG